jgi:hypothetical protein
MKEVATCDEEDDMTLTDRLHKSRSAEDIERAYRKSLGMSSRQDSGLGPLAAQKASSSSKVADSSSAKAAKSAKKAYDKDKDDGDDGEVGAIGAVVGGGGDDDDDDDGE